MFPHLDDPTPPQPSELIVDRIVAEGARRVRRRRVAASGSAAVLLALSAAGIAGRLPGQQDDDKVQMPAGVDDTTVPAPSTAPPTTDHNTGQSETGVGGGTTTTSQPTSTTRSPIVVMNEVFAAAIQKPGADTVQIVLANALTGKVDRVLTEFPMFDRGDGCCVAYSEDRQWVYYDAQDEATAKQIMWRVDTHGGKPQRIGPGYDPVISPDGNTLIYKPTGATEDPLVVRDLVKGSERRVAIGTGWQVSTYGFLPDGNIVVAGGEVNQSLMSLWELNPGAANTAQAHRIGPATDAPAGTSWEVSDLDTTDGRVVVVQTCCNGDLSSASLIHVDAATGAVTGTVALPAQGARGVISPGGNRTLLLVPPTDNPGPNTLQLYSSKGTDTVPLQGVLAIDW